VLAERPLDPVHAAEPAAGLQHARELVEQRGLDPASLTWLVLHETLEEEHADESMALARMLPDDPAAHAVVCAGATALQAAGYRYFDDLYEVLFR
jgi:hypothetical protein